MLLLSSTRARSASKFAGSLSCVYLGAATCWAICSGIGAGGIIAGGVGTRTSALSLFFHAFSLWTGLLLLLFFSCPRF